MKSTMHQRSGARVPAAGAGAETLTPSPSSHKQQRSPRVIYKENLDPSPSPADPSPLRPSAKPLVQKNIRSPLPPRPPSNPLKRKLILETLPEHGSPASDDLNVQVVVRMRPSNKDDEQGDHIVQRIPPNSISILDHTFTFDSVAGTNSTQQDIYQLVGFPLVENCLAGFNSSIFAYGQTGSGKTYTMWGPPSALSEDDLSSNERGLTPRVFDRLFARINEEQVKHADKKLNYQCRCSFLEIYNEQITDLLDPLQRNLQIREDVRTGVYVESLKEEYVYTMKDVNCLLLKGLSNRRTGATSINAESSRSHCVFTCIVESRSKSMADGLSSLRTSRINLVDLAGSERQKMTGAAGDRLKEAGNINRSLSQLGNLINILAEVSQSGKLRHIPYRDSKLTFLLQDSLGGNAKLAMICAISPSQSCKNETFSTLRFAQRAKAIKNKAVVNEVTRDDVNGLREQIRQLKDELLRMKSNGGTPDGTYSTGWNARRSLNLLKMSLNRPTTLPVLKDDSDEEMEIDEDDVEMSNNQAIIQTLSSNDKLCVPSKGPRVSSSSAEEMQPTNSLRPICDSNQVCGTVEEEKTLNKVYPGSEMEVSNCPDNAHDYSSKLHTTDEKDFTLKENNRRSESNSLKGNTVEFQDSSIGRDLANISVPDSSNMSSSPRNSSVSLSSLSIVPCETSPILHSPTLSVSPVLESYSRKSIRTSSSMSASQKSIENAKSESGALNISFVGISDSKRKLLNTSFSQTSKSSLAPTECIAASLQRGLQVFENHQYGSSLRRSSFRFSARPIDLKSLGSASKVSVGVQTLQESEVLSDSSPFICSSCKSKASAIDAENIVDEMNLQLVPINGPESPDKPKNFVPKAVEKVLAGSIRREMALEDHCTKQAAEIAQLNRLVQQYKHERECNAVIEQTREDKISRLEVLMDGILPTEEFMEEEFISLTNEHKILKEKYENHPDVLRVNIELKRVQAELDAYRNFFDMGEKDVLMEEIQDLRSQLQYYLDSSSIPARSPSQLIKLNHSTGPISATHGTISVVNEASTDKLEQERRHWAEAESKWISLSEDLRLELEANRSLAQKLKVELESERKCAEELKEALQTAMQGHARVLEQYADLQEKHIALHGRHREISNGIEDVKRAAAKAGVKGAESRFINSLAAEISALRVEREKERQFWRDENRGLQTQLRDTAEAVQAAGELLVRLKEAEEAAAIAERRAGLAEQETEKAYQEIDNLKKNYDTQIVTLKQLLAKSQLPKEAQKPTLNDANVANCDVDFEPYSHGGDVEFSRGTEPYEWYSGYDRCNI